MVGDSTEADVVTQDGSGDLSIDVVFSLLAEQRRRHALACLLDHDRAILLSDLAEDVAVREADRRHTEIPEETVQKVHMSLYHVHLPKLAEAGVVEYDTDRDVVEAADPADLLSRALILADSASPTSDPA